MASPQCRATSDLRPSPVPVISLILTTVAPFRAAARIATLNAVSRCRNGAAGERDGSGHLDLAAAPGGEAGHAPVAGHRPQAAGDHDHKARHRDWDDIDHHSGEQQPNADHEPQRRCDDPAPVVHPRVGRMHGLSKPTVTGAERLLDLLELAPLMLSERHDALRWNSGRAGTLL